MKIAHKKKGEFKMSSDENIYEILKKIPVVPAKFNLTKDQKYWWRWFASELIATKQFCKADIIHLQQASFWLDARCKAYEVINEKNKKGNLDGMVQVFANKTNNITGWMTVVKDADKALDNISAHFGLSFKDRNKLGQAKKIDENQLSLFEQFKNRNTN